MGRTHMSEITPIESIVFIIFAITALGALYRIVTIRQEFDR